MNDRTRRTRALIACGAMLSGCAVAGEPVEVPAGPPVAPIVPPAPSGDAAASAVSVDGLKATLEAAFADAEKQTGVSRSALQLVSAAIVTWRDGSLGCPSPSNAYPQVLVPGYRIQIKAGSRQLDYHANARGTLLLCPAGRAEEPIQGEAI